MLGYAYVGGLLEPFIVSDINLRRLETMRGLNWMARTPGYVPIPKTGVLPMALGGGSGIGSGGGGGGSGGGGGGSGSGSVDAALDGVQTSSICLSTPAQHRFPGIGHRYVHACPCLSMLQRAGRPSCACLQATHTCI